MADSLSFTDFLERMKDPRAADLVRDIRAFVKAFEGRPPDPDRDSTAAQAFYEVQDAAFAVHPLWAGAPPAVLEAAGEGLEKYVTTKIHAATFATAPLDVERDEALALRLRALSFVEPAHLDMPPSAVDERAVGLAGRELLKVNQFKAPRDKLVCILNCCRVLNNALAGAAAKAKGSEPAADAATGAPSPAPSSSRAPGADDFLPALVYTLIKAAPPQLASNLEYVQRFRGAGRLGGEGAYFFTQLYGAASFVETITTASLSVDPALLLARMAAAGVPDMQLLPRPDNAGGEGEGVGKHVPVAAAAAAAAAAAGVSPRGGGGGLTSRAGSGAAAASSLLLPPPPATAADLEAEGVPLVLAADAAGALADAHAWLYSEAGSLSLNDVPALLQAYKDAVLRAEAVCRAADARAAAWGGGRGRVAAVAAPAPAAGAAAAAATTASGGLASVSAEEAAPAVESPAVAGGGATAAAGSTPPSLEGLVLSEDGGGGAQQPEGRREEPASLI